jgi:hypothetical protein
MKTHRPSYFFAAVSAAVVSFAISSEAHAKAACGTIEVAKGDVKVQSGKTKKVDAASVGGKVCSGDTVIAAKDSRAKLKMDDGNELNISPDSRIVLEDYQFNPAENKKKVLLNVIQGKVRAATKEENMYNDKAKDGQANSFQVRTKSAVAGVRGTDFLTGFDPKTSKSEVVAFKGRVEVGQPGPGGQILNPVQISAGQRTEALPGQPPAPPAPVPKRELDNVNAESSAETAAGPSGAGVGSAVTENSTPEAKEESGSKPAQTTAAAGTEEKAPESKPEAKPEAKTEAKPEAKSEAKQAGRQDARQESQSPGSGEAGPASTNANANANNDKNQSSNANANSNQRSGSNSGERSTSGATGTSSPAGTVPRAPASTGSMIDSRDMGGGALVSPSVPNVPGANLPVVTVAPPVLVPIVPVCQICNEAIQTGPAKLNIIVNVGQ